MLENKVEFLFNILMMNEIPFVRYKGKKEFILLDQKVRIATFNATPELKFRLDKLGYSDYIFKEGIIEPSFLSDLLNIDWIAKYKSITI